MNKQGMMQFAKFLVEMNKKLIDEDKRYNLSEPEKEALKQGLDEYYEEFKRKVC